MPRRRTLLGAAPLAGMARAQPAWPDRPVRLVVPWPAGGPTDNFARALARELAPLLGQTVVVDNRTGATGTVGIGHVARGPADGHTLLVANTTAYVGSVVALGDTVPFDPLRDFVPIGLFVESYSVLWAHPALGVRDLDALLARARDPAKSRLAFGTTGSGSVSEQSVEQLARHFRLDLTKVPYRGTAPQVTDLVAGHVQIGTADYATAAPHAREGRLLPLLVIGRQRLPELPGTPASAELGLTEPDFTIWNGLFAPAATPAPVVARLEAALAAALRTEAMRAVTEGNGNRPILQSGAEGLRRIATDLESRRAFARSIPGEGS
ncbi:Bug family tripartite tricarboxylate transporter substrate binding protein [Paracraurococcus ruber]|uniref:ABC transporter substrate-binding protein n=1 Tax=Paracraurococcus ruber TaxID=77675 RepID=A0ABS1CQS2_9PROT|nr:tripartite tricarboxylate transporter substrate binding protein [Paracraurococcus ruber]MBK1656647.1 ABC transporter substrate-binding protein [Paracraurococcus ruber]TDG33730.1 tripartite tricarboxylate transporter substrate binding protein [Paracraurococcus ruber]